MNRDLHRPTIHFSPPANWMNDPCGLVWHNGLFHLYYQHNPQENRWGPMHWGHAVSEDLFRWRDRPVALYPDATHGMAFTGSAVVVDASTAPAGAAGPAGPGAAGPADTGGPASAKPKTTPTSTSTPTDNEAPKAGSVPPLRAIYTGALPQGSIHATRQQQCLAVSTDGDRWEPRGVVLPNPGVPDFRDPKVGRHARTGRWYLVLAAGDHVQFYSSPDLKQWSYESSFGRGLGYTEGEWECPDLFQLPLPQDLSPGEPQGYPESEPQGGSPDAPAGEPRWVLVVHVGRGLSNRYAGAQYITGEFDGHQFHAAETDFRPVDQGHDFYAAQSWNGTTRRRIWIAWASHWAHSDATQTTGWAGTLTLPRELSLVRDGAEGVALCQQPARELAALTAD
ncbi:MAG: glycoside hydrolase family 32 protein, partial [Alkalispirochaeta sp.]